MTMYWAAFDQLNLIESSFGFTRNVIFFSVVQTGHILTYVLAAISL